MNLIFNLAIVFIVWAVADTQLDRIKKKLGRDGKLEFDKVRSLIKLLNFLQSVLGFLLIPMGWFGIYICFNENWGWKDIRYCNRTSHSYSHWRNERISRLIH